MSRPGVLHDCPFASFAKQSLIFLVNWGPLARNGLGALRPSWVSRTHPTWGGGRREGRAQTPRHRSRTPLPWGPKEAPAVERAARPWMPPPQKGMSVSPHGCLSPKQRATPVCELGAYPDQRAVGLLTGSEWLHDEPSAFAATAIGAAPTQTSRL